MTDTIKPIIFWFRNDLRTIDNSGFYEAVNKGYVVPIFILDNITEKKGSASKWWLHNSLHNLNLSLNNNLNVYIGKPKDILLQVIKNTNACGVYWNRCYEPELIKRDADIKKHLKELAITVKSFQGNLLFEPFDILKEDNTAYKVFTPFYRAFSLKTDIISEPLPKPKILSLVKDTKNSTTIDQLNLIPNHTWHKKLEQHWTVGEQAAQKQLKYFIMSGLEGYKEKRDFPSYQNVSRLSPYLHFGEISVNSIWHTLIAEKKDLNINKDIDFFLRELGWREFSHNLLYHFPDLPHKNFQKKFDNFAWENNSDTLRIWQKGETGYPIIDAGMRQLWETGYMHNRVRMIVASFLVKNLGIHWQDGQNWFWDCLVDADLANNSASWQWVAGCGADASPYFRIFNPILQAQKFDPSGEYIKTFIPELKNLSIPFLFAPWNAPESVLKKANIILGKTYPKPIINLDLSRKKALGLYKRLT